MKLLIFAAMLFALPLSEKNPDPMSVHQFKAKAIDGGTIDFEKFKGKKILIVNTASKCGYTKQYAQLEELHKAHGDKLVIVGFPANNFGGQEPGSNEDIAAFCEKNFSVSFQMAAKVSVKGSDQHALFKWLTAEKNPDFTGDINWNFEKFLIDEKGHLVRRYRSGADPLGEEILGAI
jgi:glutathione peroxidase